MPFTEEQFGVWFNYRPPTEEEKILLRRIWDAETRCLQLHARLTEERMENWTVAIFEEITRECRHFADEVNAVCPDGADKTAAIRNLKLLRNAMNDMGAPNCAGIVRGASERHAIDQIIEARRNANSAIMCKGV